MSIGTTAALTIAGIGAAGSIAGSAISAHAAGKAADTQSAAAGKATGTVTDATKQANDIIAGGNQTLTDAQQKQLAALKPYIDSGQISLTQLQELLGTNGPLSGVKNQFSFTPQDWQNDPQFAFIKQEAERGLQHQAAAGGVLGTGGTERAGARLATGLASTQLDSAFNRALQTYDTNRQNVLMRIQGLQGLTGMGFQATGLQNQDIGNTAQMINQNQHAVAANDIAAGRYSGDVGLKATEIGAEALGAKANAQSAADMASASAWNTGIGGAVNAFQPVVYGLPTVGLRRTGNVIDMTGGNPPTPAQLGAPSPYAP